MLPPRPRHRLVVGHRPAGRPRPLGNVRLLALRKAGGRMSVTVYVSCGNSDDKLSQHEWSNFVAAVDRTFEQAARYQGSRVHGRWYSLPTEPWQNACWCIEFLDETAMAGIIDAYRAELARLAGVFRQDSIAWAVAPTTEFLGAVPDAR